MPQFPNFPHDTMIPTSYKRRQKKSVQISPVCIRQPYSYQRDPPRLIWHGFQLVPRVMPDLSCPMHVYLQYQSIDHHVYHQLGRSDHQIHVLRRRWPWIFYACQILMMLRRAPEKKITLHMMCCWAGHCHRYRYTIQKYNEHTLFKYTNFRYVTLPQ